MNKKNKYTKNDDKEFLDGLARVFDENEEILGEAFDTLKKQPNEDGMLFSKKFRDHMAEFGDKSPLEALKDENFWRHLAKYAGIPQEDIDRIINEKE